ncbi:3-phosphoglycerate dehydrogenase [Anopheles sinensis]|uniref:3-phosphoglycerate dehydrogenase n=1 Tax=Anopheles sinensis TaxID=74873 RepID=A0A084VLK0_ANOSI|nr:3-phosphoglycerate dehydrogenase [Anopheles sinensis]
MPSVSGFHFRAKFASLGNYFAKRCFLTDSPIFSLLSNNGSSDATQSGKIAIKTLIAEYKFSLFADGGTEGGRWGLARIGMSVLFDPRNLRRGFIGLIAFGNISAGSACRLQGIGEWR